MKIKFHFIRFILSGLIILDAAASFGQVLCDEKKHYQLLNNSFQCKWVFFNLKDTVSGIVLKHERKVEPCGAWASATVTIVKCGLDTIRVLDLCSESNFSKGQKVKISPADNPGYQVYIPFYYDVIDEITNQHISRTNEYDERILRTTWGTID